MRKTKLWALILLCGTGAALSQSPESANLHSQPSGDLPTFRITTREVIVDVFALRGKNQPVTDLTPADLQVSEAFVAQDSNAIGKRHRSAKPSAEAGTIKSLHLIDPNAPQHSGADSQVGFAIGTSCLERSTLHYRLAFRPGPDGWHSGYHQVFVTTTRPGVRLFYRHRYYVGLSEPPAQPPIVGSEAIEKLLVRAACYYPDTPPSISIQAHLIQTGRTDVLRYAVTIDANSVSFLTLGNDADPSKGLVERYAELDYAVCNFSTTGQPINFFHAPVVKNLNSADYARALDRGFPHTLEFPTPEHLGVTRVVVRDRATGNLGAVDVAYNKPQQTVAMQSAPAAAQTADLKALLAGWHPLINPVMGPVGSFGSIVPAPHTFCGDVYELPRPSSDLPDFRELDPIGSIYASTLNVPDQIFENTSGIPGVTPRTNLFGIDYHGVLQITAPGEYQFLMLSDDGAILRIDDKKVIDLDGLHMAYGKFGRMLLNAGSHSIEVQYYQGAVNAVALQLGVKPPGAPEWKLLDLNEYVAPAGEKIGTD